MKTETQRKLEELRRDLDESLRQGCPLKPKAKQEKPKPEPKSEPAEVFSLDPYGNRLGRKPWRAYPIAHSSAQPYEPTPADRLQELRLANAEEARKARIRASDGMNLYGEETLEDLLRRQDEHWRK